MDFLKPIYITYFLNFCAHSKGIVFDEESNFLAVSRTKAFVDKTILMKTVFQSGCRMLITAPRKFGKSTNLVMIKTFLSKESSKHKEISDTFINLKICINDTNFCNEHFGKHPVLHVDFKTGSTRNYKEAIYSYKRAIHKAYLQHEYLITSQCLSEGEKKMCNLWCGECTYEKQGEGRVKSGLAALARMLNKHFNKTVVVLIDEYDSVINNALFGLKSNSKFLDIQHLTSDMLIRLLKGNDNVQIAVLTGVSYISTAGLSDVNNLRRYRFLDDHPFVDFYGLTEDEVRQLLNKDDFKLLSNKSELAKKFYNGYICKKGRRIYNTFSFLMFLETRKVIPHWETTDYTSSIIRILDYPEMPNTIRMLLDGQSINISLYDKISLKDVLNLKDLYSYSRPNTALKPDSNLIISHLFELGLVTYNQTFSSTDFDYDYQEKTIQVNIPNWEVHNMLFNKFKNYYIEKCDLSRSLDDANYLTFMKYLKNVWKLSNNPCKKFIEVFFTAAARDA